MWADIISGVKAIGGWVQLNRDNGRLQRRELVDALSELHRAANLTRAFAADASLHGYEEAGNRFREIPFRGDWWELSEAWRKVAEKLAGLSDDSRIRDVFKDLYERCFVKAQFWADPKGYRDSGVDIELGKLVDEVARAIEHVRDGAFK
jgi:hypothetical protein